VRNERGRLCDKLGRELPEGPWHAESDHEAFEYAGLAVRLHRNANTLGWCGYVGLPPWHPWVVVIDGSGSIDWQKIDAEVHGGLTYGQDRLPYEDPNAPGFLHWLGFDCGHAGDLAPAFLNIYSTGLRDYGGDTYRTVEYVRAEATRLAEQARAAMPERI
jgi:hypothetical protein